MKFERLFENILSSKFSNWAACEQDWEEVTEEFVKKDLAAAYTVTCQMQQERPWLKWENAELLFTEGKIISVPFKYYRAKNLNPKCGLCGCSIMDTPEAPAISRRDNKTVICSDCGVKEALDDITNTRE